MATNKQGFIHRLNDGTREDWLSRAAGLLVPIIEERTTLHVNAYRIGVGDLGAKTLGECWPKAATDDSVSEITITLRHDTTPQKILGTLVHELLHAAGIHGHRRDFAKAGRDVGLTGKPTVMGFIEDAPDYLPRIIEVLGPFPNPSLRAGRPLDAPKPQKARMIKVECDECGMVWRTTRQWLEQILVLTCPNRDCDGRQVVHLPN